MVNINNSDHHNSRPPYTYIYIYIYIYINLDIEKVFFFLKKEIPRFPGMMREKHECAKE